jgi:ligand-binding SRPBCC domain-containing protein
MIVERQNIIDAPSERVWERLITSEGINDELRPWMTMSMSRGAESLTVDNIPGGTPIGRCWMRLFGVLPFRLRQLDDRRALAGSRLSRGVDDAVHAAMAPRAHPGPDSTAKTLVRDRLTFELRGPMRLLTPIVATGIGALFGHRQRRLQRHFGRG